MQQVTLCVDPILIQFYSNIAIRAEKTVEEVMAEALFKLAAELSLESLKKKQA